MSSGKWVSSRVLQQKISQTGPTEVGSKIGTDAGISAERIREQPAAGPDVDVPTSHHFEYQEATDALSNLAHNASSEQCTVHQLVGEAIITPAPNSSTFNEDFLARLEDVA